MNSSIALNKKGLLVWIICALFFTYEFLLRTVVGTFEMQVMDELHLTLFQFSFVSSTAYLFIYGLMQLPVGILVSNYGLKKTLFLACLICAVACFGMSFSFGFADAIFYRILMGFGSAFGFVCLLVSVFEWIPRKSVGLFIGLSQFIGTLGPMGASGPVLSMAESNLISWRSLFLFLGIIGLVLSFFIFRYVENNHDRIDKFTVLTPKINWLKNLKLLLRERQVWLIAFFSASSYFFLEYLSENEGAAFLKINHFSSSFAAYMITLGWLSYALACPILGAISDHIHRRQSIMVVSGLSGVMATVGLVYFPLNNMLLISYFILLGVAAAGQSIGFATIAEQSRYKYQKLSVAFNNFSITFISALNAPVLAVLLSVICEVQKASVFNHQTYQYAFNIVIFLNVLALIIAVFFIEETFCKNKKDSTLLSLND